jgi:catechol 2,3-dioxygenase-like lactoylglutathione lyase family enzyme
MRTPFDVLTVMRRPEGRTLVMDVLPASFPWVRYLPAHEMRRFSVELAADDRLSGCRRILTGMACRISELVIKCADPDRLAAFWSDVLGYVELGREDDGSIEIGPPDAGFGGPQPTLVLSPSSDPRTGKLRLHIDVNPTDRDQDAELERLLALGARPADVGQTGTESWHVLADPEGNEFCLLRTRLQPL